MRSRFVLLSILTAALACADTEPTAPLLAADGHAPQLASASSPSPEVATLRALVAPLHTLAKAQEAGFVAPLSECVEAPPGGMGFHWGNPTRLDGVVQWDQPEVLVFHPAPNSRDGLRLGAVEYVVPMAAWAGAEPPTLFGQTFIPGGPGGSLWTLHVWLGNHNPSGMFAEWNPRVSCGS